MSLLSSSSPFIVCTHAIKRHSYSRRFYDYFKWIEICIWKAPPTEHFPLIKFDTNIKRQTNENWVRWEWVAHKISGNCRFSFRLFMARCVYAPHMRRTTLRIVAFVGDAVLLSLPRKKKIKKKKRKIKSFRIFLQFHAKQNKKINILFSILWTIYFYCMVTY